MLCPDAIRESQRLQVHACWLPAATTHAFSQASPCRPGSDPTGHPCHPSPAPSRTVRSLTAPVPALRPRVHCPPPMEPQLCDCPGGLTAPTLRGSLRSRGPESPPGSKLQKSHGPEAGWHAQSPGTSLKRSLGLSWAPSARGPDVTGCRPLRHRQQAGHGSYPGASRPGKQPGL